jgi:hypothetical protein
MLRSRRCFLVLVCSAAILSGAEDKDVFVLEVEGMV